ncbi:hypothetical protein ABZX77_17645 [Streptomyces sp. NPDC004237]|uniref:hypothetical protein n=1 Tax=Streptomyces sp. NPDC004237 TaxID=3154455 RepID=UPI00339E2B0F
MIASRHYQLVFRKDAPAVPVGISLNVPVLRKRTLREAVLPDEPAALLGLLRTVLGLETPWPARSAESARSSGQAKAS